jgi:hypothetical protein
MTDPPVKNPDRVPGILQGFDATSSTGGVGVTITKSMINPETIQVTETEPFMSERESKDVITEDGVYTDEQGNSFQYRKGHVLAEGEKANLKKTGDFPEPEGTGEAEHRETKADQAPDNKAAPDPSNKQRG